MRCGRRGARDPAFFLDCSATLPWIFADEVTPASDRLLDDLSSGAQAWVPALWPFELGNVLLGAQRRKRIDQAGVEAFLAKLKVYAIDVDDQSVAHAWAKTLDLALLYQLSTYDAAYLELALRRHLPLSTLDADLIRAAGITGIGLCLQGARGRSPKRSGRSLYWDTDDTRWSMTLAEGFLPKN